MSYEDLSGIVQFVPLQTPLHCDYLRSRFEADFSSTVALLARELRMLSAEHAVMEIDFRPQDLRRDGMPRSDRRAQTPGLRLAFFATEYERLPQLRYEVAKWRSWQENVRALALGLEHLRANGRYGFSENGEQYQGYAQLGSGSGQMERVQRGRELISRHGGVREALHATHPDHEGGNQADLEAVVAARDAARPA